MYLKCLGKFLTVARCQAVVAHNIRSFHNDSCHQEVRKQNKKWSVKSQKKY
jgi:hypothetical protein